MWVFVRVSLLRTGIAAAAARLVARPWLALLLTAWLTRPIAQAQSPDTATGQKKDLVPNADSTLLLWQQAVASGDATRLQDAATATALLKPLHLTAASLEKLAAAMDGAIARLGSKDAEIARGALQNFLPATLAVPATPRGSQHLAALALRLARYRLLQDQPALAGDCLHVADVLLERAAVRLPDASGARLLIAHSRETARLLTLAGTSSDALQRLERARIQLPGTADATADLAELAIIAAAIKDVPPLTKYRLLESLLFTQDGQRLIVPEPAWTPIAPNAVLLPSLPPQIRSRWFPTPSPVTANAPHGTSSDRHGTPVLPLAELVKTAVASGLSEDLEHRLTTLVNLGHTPALLARLLLRLEQHQLPTAAEDARKLLTRQRTTDAGELQLDQQLLWALQQSGNSHWLLSHPALMTLPPHSLAPADQLLRTMQSPQPATDLLWCEDPEFGRDSGPLIQAAGISADGLLLHHTQRGSASCLLPWPVSAPATLSLRTLLAPAMQAGIGFDGFAVLTAASSDRSLAAGLGSQPSISRAGRFQQPGEFGWQSVRLHNAEVRLAVNGHPLWRMPLESASFPWLMLQIDGFGMGVFSHLQLADTVQVPREVRLSADASLHGWSAHRYGQLLPLSRRTPAVTPTTSATAPTRNADWFIADDTISSRAPVEPASAIETFPLTTLAFLQYQRPLRAHEVLTWDYEFQPGADGDCLTLGSLAIRVRPDGVFLHGVPVSPTEWILFPPEHEYRVNGDAAVSLPVRPGWNTASLRMEAHRGVLSVNAQEVLVLPLETLSDTRPGLCCRRSRPPVRVRRMLLSGDWPEQVSNAQLQELLTANSSGRFAEEWLQQRRAGEVLEQSRSAALDTRWQQLSAWVLPDAIPGQLRTAGTIKSSAADIASGPHINSPLQDLIRVADLTGRRDELDERLQSLPAVNRQAGTHRAAALALLAVMTRQPTARQRLEELISLLSADAAGKSGVAETMTVPGTATVGPSQTPADVSMWPLLAICEEAGPEPEHPGVLLRLLDTALPKGPAEVQASETPPQALRSLTASLRTRLQHAHAARTGMAVKFADQKAPELPLSSPASRLHAWQQTSSSAEGRRFVATGTSEWLPLADGRVLLAPRSVDASLFSPSPLAGDFVFELHVRVAADAATGARQLPLMGFAGVCWQPAGDGAVVELPWRESLSLATGEPAAPPAARPAVVSGETSLRRWRLERRASELTLMLDDRLVRQQTLTDREPPWLMLRCGREPGAVIEELRLEEAGPGPVAARSPVLLPFTAELVGWDRPSFSQGGLFRPERQVEADWRMNEARLTGAFRSESMGSWRPSHLCFLPPLPLRGKVSWSFRYEPGRALVHPTVGDRVLLLEAGAGVRVGELRQILREQVELSAATVMNACVRIAESQCDLSTEAWQQASLEITEDELQLQLNGEPAAALMLGTQADRRLGFFHWSDQTAAEIRSLQLEPR
ncbi:MAG: DUF1583 domain-containing protein [Planctomycetota bacterium]